MFARLVAASAPYRVGAPPAPKLVVTPSEEFTAYTQGGTVYVSEGMVKAIGVTDELAFVFSHEITHIDRQHGPTRPAVEREADVIGRCISDDAGYDPHAAVAFFERLNWPSDETWERLEFLRETPVREYC